MCYHLKVRQRQCMDNWSGMFKKKKENEEKKPWRGGFRDSAEYRQTHRSQPNFNCLLRKCKRFYWFLKEVWVNERPIVSTSVRRVGAEVVLRGGLCPAPEALKHRGWSSASSAVKNTWRIKLFFSSVKKKKKRESPAAQFCLHKRLLCKVTKLEVMALRKYKKCDCFGSSKQKENLPSGQ